MICREIVWNSQLVQIILPAINLGIVVLSNLIKAMLVFVNLTLLDFDAMEFSDSALGLSDFLYTLRMRYHRRPCLLMSGSEVGRFILHFMDPLHAFDQPLVHLRLVVFQLLVQVIYKSIRPLFLLGIQLPYHDVLLQQLLLGQCLTRRLAVDSCGIELLFTFDTVTHSRFQSLCVLVPQLYPILSQSPSWRFQSFIPTLTLCTSIMSHIGISVVIQTYKGSSKLFLNIMIFSFH